MRKFKSFLTEKKRTEGGGMPNYQPGTSMKKYAQDVIPHIGLGAGSSRLTAALRWGNEVIAGKRGGSHSELQPFVKERGKPDEMGFVRKDTEAPDVAGPHGGYFYNRQAATRIGNKHPELKNDSAPEDPKYPSQSYDFKPEREGGPYHAMVDKALKGGTPDNPSFLPSPAGALGGLGRTAMGLGKVIQNEPKPIEPSPAPREPVHYKFAKNPENIGGEIRSPTGEQTGQMQTTNLPQSRKTSLDWIENTPKGTVEGQRGGTGTGAMREILRQARERAYQQADAAVQPRPNTLEGYRLSGAKSNFPFGEKRMQRFNMNRLEREGGETTVPKSNKKLNPEEMPDTASPTRKALRSVVPGLGSYDAASRHAYDKMGGTQGGYIGGMLGQMLQGTPKDYYKNREDPNNLTAGFKGGGQAKAAPSSPKAPAETSPQFAPKADSILTAREPPQTTKKTDQFGPIDRMRSHYGQWSNPAVKPWDLSPSTPMNQTSPSPQFKGPGKYIQPESGPQPTKPAKGGMSIKPLPPGEGIKAQPPSGKGGISYPNPLQPSAPPPTGGSGYSNPPAESGSYIPKGGLQPFSYNAAGGRQSTNIESPKQEERPSTPMRIPFNSAGKRGFSGTQSGDSPYGRGGEPLPDWTKDKEDGKKPKRSHEHAGLLFYAPWEK